MKTSWITLNPEWYVEERSQLAVHYPGFWVDEDRLAQGELVCYGELIVRSNKGTAIHPIEMEYPESTPHSSSNRGEYRALSHAMEWQCLVPSQLKGTGLHTRGPVPLIGSARPHLVR